MSICSLALCGWRLEVISWTFSKPANQASNPSAKHNSHVRETKTTWSATENKTPQDPKIGQKYHPDIQTRQSRGSIKYPENTQKNTYSVIFKYSGVYFRRESSGGMEWLGVWNCIFSGSEFSNFGAWNLAKSALSAEFQGFSCKFRPLKNIFRTLENGHSIRHQSIPPLRAARYLKGYFRSLLFVCWGGIFEFLDFPVL